MSHRAESGDGRPNHAKRTSNSASITMAAENDSTHPTKRSRVSRACDQCRASREKCDGAQPTCVTCVALKRTCSYKEPPKKRGIQPNYIRTLELTLTWLLQTFPEAEKLLATSLTDSKNPTNLLISAKDTTASEATLEAWRNSLVCKQIDQLLSGVPVEQNGRFLATEQISEVDDPPAVDEQQPSSPLPADSHMAVSLHNAYDVDLQPTQPGKNHEPARDLYGAAQSAELVVLPSNAWLLLEYYFAFTHTWLPMTEKHDMLKLMYCYPGSGLRFSEMSAAGHAELWSILSLSSAQITQDEDPAEVARIRKVAEQLLPIGKTAYESPHIKAMLVLAVLEMHDGDLLAAWLRVGSVIRLLLLFKLLYNAGAREKWCRHINLAAFVLESALATSLRAPSHLRVSYIDPMGYVDEDGIEEWSVWSDPLFSGSENQNRSPARSFSTLNHLVRMSRQASIDQAAPEPGGKPSSRPAVWRLLTNASSKYGRVHPHVLVTTYIEDSGLDASAREVTDLNTSGAIEQDGARNGIDAGAGTGAALSLDVSEMPQYSTHSMATDAYDPDNGHAEALLIPHNDYNATTVWTNDMACQNTQPKNVTADTSNGHTNIFEEFDALLETEDTNHHPQFMQNLGFAPDLDLAEFFGADYQPSDPLLAYIDPLRYGIAYR